MRRLPILTAVVLLATVEAAPVLHGQNQTPINLAEANLKAPRRLKEVPPVLPESAALTQPGGARRAHLVEVDITIDARGKVIDAVIARRPAGRKSPAAIAPDLEQPALVAVRQWEYEPTIVAGKAVPVILRESVMFREFVNPTEASRERTTGGRRTPVTGLSKGSTGIPRDRATGIDLPWTYSDVTMAPGYDRTAEIERPITALAAALEREGLACMASFRNPTGGVIEMTNYGSVTYLVQCEGNCTGLIYGAAASAPVQNRGADRRYPLLYLRSYDPARRRVYFKFVQSDPTLVADIKVHAFRVKGSATGSGCRF